MRISDNARPRGLDASRIADREGVNTSARGRGSANKTRAQITAGHVNHQTLSQLPPREGVGVGVGESVVL